MTDFTVLIFKSFLEALKSRYKNFISFSDFRSEEIIKSDYSSFQDAVILRHDVDRNPRNALVLAQLEHSFDMKGTYNFRAVSESYDLTIMNKIAKLGHEIGYHYEDVDLVYRSHISEIRYGNGEINRNKIIDLAYESFCNNLKAFRKNFDIKTICMHGSPRAKFDNKIIWEKYSYKELGLIGEPYYDIDFNEFGYFSDTGRRWNGNNVSVRDKVDSKYEYNFKSTQDIKDNIDKLPPKIMFTIHPQRWNDKILPWLNEYFSQNIKNIIKKYFFVQKT